MKVFHPIVKLASVLSAVTFGMEIGTMVIMGNLDKSRVGPQETPAAATVRVSMTSTSSEE